MIMTYMTYMRYIFKYIYIYTYIYIHLLYKPPHQLTKPTKIPQNVLQDIELNELQAFRADYMKFRAGQVRGVGGWPSVDRRVQGEMFKIRWDMVEMDEVWRIMQLIVFFFVMIYRGLEVLDILDGAGFHPFTVWCVAQNY